MRLLHWSTLHPDEASGIAAVRFLRPVRISSIRLYPSGAKPFQNAPEIVAETKPESFFVEMFVHFMDKGKTWLLPTRMAYAGGLVDFAVDMADETVTRLVAFKGDFQAMTIAIYGDVAPAASEGPSSEPTLVYQGTLPTHEPRGISKALDLANAQDPTLMAKQLLKLSTEEVSLPVAIRLAFCLKPTEEEWESPDLLQLIANVQDVREGDSLKDVVQMMRRPISDDTPEDDLQDFAEVVSKFPSENDHAFHVANLLSLSASQHPGLARALLAKLEPWSLFTSDSLDKETLLCLLDASTNVDVSRDLNNEDFLQTLKEVANNFKAEKAAQVAASRLATRIRQWAVFEDALNDPGADINEACGLLKEVAKEEQALGIWLESVITHDDIFKASVGAPFPQTGQEVPVIRFHDQHISTLTHTEFLTLVRTFVGVAAVLAVLVWGDEMRHDALRTRVLGILRIWQTMDGYREIVNYLLLQRGVPRRLRWISAEGEAEPRQSSILAEHILCQLCHDDPLAIINHEVVESVLSFEPPLLAVTDDELEILQDLAHISEDGLPAAVDELLIKHNRPFPARTLRVLRVAAAIIRQELARPSGLKDIMQAFREAAEERKEEPKYSPTLTGCLVDLLADMGEDLTSLFPLVLPPKMNQSLTALFFSTAEELVGLLDKVLLAFLDEPNATLPLSSRGLRSLVTAVADIFSGADLALDIYSSGSQVHNAAESVQQRCLGLVTMLSGPDVYVDAGARTITGAKVVLKTLLACGAQIHAQNSSSSEKAEGVARDPVHRLLHMYTMIDHILPPPTSTPPSPVAEDATIIIEEDIVEAPAPQQSSYWLDALPDILPEIRAFFTILDPERKILFMQRLIDLDQPNGVVGIGEWLLAEELHSLSAVFDALSSSERNSSMTVVRQYQANLGLEFLRTLAQPSTTLQWLLTGLASSSDLAQALAMCLLNTFDCNISSPNLIDLVSLLTRQAPPANLEFIPELRLALVLGMLQEALSASVIQQAVEVLQSLPDSVITVCTDTIRRVIGRTLVTCTAERQNVTTEMDQSLFKLISWLAKQSNPRFTKLAGISAYGFQSLCSSIAGSLSAEDRPSFTRLRSQFSTDPENTEVNHPFELPTQLFLPLQQIENMLEGHDTQQSSTPSTPPRQKAGMKTPEILGVIISPSTALLRAHTATATGLTKTYLNNDFRQLRQTPSARQNTSRLPSMHVDDFQVQETVTTVNPGIPMMGLPTNPEMLGYPPMMDMDQL